MNHGDKKKQESRISMVNNSASTPENEYYLMFLAASIINLHITSAYVNPVQPLATILNTWKQLLNTN